MGFSGHELQRPWANGAVQNVLYSAENDKAQQWKYTYLTKIRQHHGNIDPQVSDCCSRAITIHYLRELNCRGYHAGVQAPGIQPWGANANHDPNIQDATTWCIKWGAEFRSSLDHSEIEFWNVVRVIKDQPVTLWNRGNIMFMMNRFRVRLDDSRRSIALMSLIVAFFVQASACNEKVPMTPANRKRSREISIIYPSRVSRWGMSTFGDAMST